MALTVPIDLNPDDLRRFLGEVVGAIEALQNPQGPGTFWAAATPADLPTASAAYANTGAFVTSLGVFAICTNKTGAWAWTRADGSSL